MKRVLSTALVVALSLLLVGVAQARPIASANSDGTAPSADAYGFIKLPRKTIRFSVAGSPGLLFDIRVTLRCKRGPQVREKSFRLSAQATPLNRTVALPIKYAVECTVDVGALYHPETEEPEPLPGFVAVNVYGPSRSSI